MELWLCKANLHLYFQLAAVLFYLMNEWFVLKDMWEFSITWYKITTGNWIHLSGLHFKEIKKNHNSTGVIIPLKTTHLSMSATVCKYYKTHGPHLPKTNFCDSFCDQYCPLVDIDRNYVSKRFTHCPWYPTVRWKLM